MNDFDIDAALRFLANHWLTGAIISPGLRVIWLVDDELPWIAAD